MAAQVYDHGLDRLYDGGGSVLAVERVRDDIAQFES